jgi:hypothetical protein
MSTKFKVAALGAALAVLAAPGVASAQEGFGNYRSAEGLRDASAAPANRSQSPRRRAFETDRDSRDCRPGTSSEVCARADRNTRD